MEKLELLNTHGKSKVKNVAGILHNYTINDSISSHEQLEHAIRKWEHMSLEQAFPHLEEFLEF